MSDGSDDVWEDSKAVSAPAAAERTLVRLPDASALQRSLVELQRHPEGRGIVAQVVTWVRQLPRQHSSAEFPAADQALSDAHSRWLQEPVANVDDALWLQLMEIGAWLAIYTKTQAIPQQLKTTALRPASMPGSAAFCDRQRQVAFSIGLFDAVVSPLVASSHANEQAVARLLDVFFTWMTRAMNSYEFVFLHHIAQPLAAHIQRNYGSVPNSIAVVVKKLVQAGGSNWKQSAPQLAVALVLLSGSALPSSVRLLGAKVAEDLLSHDAFPHVHSPTAIVAAALPVCSLSVVPSPLVHQFIALRAATLALLSPRLLIESDDYSRLLERLHESVYRQSSSDDRVPAACFKMVDACTTEIRTSMAANRSLLHAVLKATQNRSDEQLFRASLLTLYQSEAEESEFPADAFLAAVYDIASTTINAFSQAESRLLSCFSSLVKLEFARECCPTPHRNDLVILLTQRVEDLVQNAPDSTLPSLANIVLGLEASAHDPVFGWACLTIGQIVQRKLRVVLLQANADARRDAIAVVFAGLYHGLAPVNAFAHSFLGFSLSSLGQFVSMYELFPYYLQETLRKYPVDASNDQVATVIGTIFGALYYTSTKEAETTEELSALETRNAMVQWALRQCRARVTSLLQTEDRASGLYLAELFLEVAKMAPVEMLPVVAKEMEALVDSSAAVDSDHKLLREVKTRVLNAVSLNCEAEKRAWLAAWFLELDQHYPAEVVAPEQTTAQADQQPAARL